MKVSIIIPAHNEENTIQRVIEEVVGIDLRALKLGKEIIVVDDGSTDNTLQKAKELVPYISPYDPTGQIEIKILEQKKREGKSTSIRRALSQSEGEIILIQDADLEYKVSNYPELLRPIIEGRAEVVYGSRFLKKRHPSQMPFMYLVANKILTLVTNLLYSSHVTDMYTCHKVLRKEVLKSLNLRCRGFGFGPEVTAKLGLKGIKIYEVPTEYEARPDSRERKISWKDGFRALFILLRYRFKSQVESEVESP